MIRQGDALCKIDGILRKVLCGIEWFAGNFVSQEGRTLGTIRHLYMLTLLKVSSCRSKDGCEQVTSV